MENFGHMLYLLVTQVKYLFSLMIFTFISISYSFSSEFKEE